ncbi:hypothetical protein ACFPFW_08475 [Flaviflagellibacter deserti]|uniref:Uncharacterized protein n=1 Tax=Flaviflagellibacter deserti TaxID=2267266 RepID=A0ABV9Z2Q7_9HYPH
MVEIAYSVRGSAPNGSLKSIDCARVEDVLEKILELSLRGFFDIHVQDASGHIYEAADFVVACRQPRPDKTL